MTNTETTTAETTVPEVAEKKRTKAAHEGTVTTFTFVDGTTASFDVAELPEDIKTALLHRGLVNKLAANDSDTANAVFTQLKEGLWNAQRNGGGSTVTYSYTVRALLRYLISKGKTEATLEGAQALYSSQTVAYQRKLSLDSGIQVLVEQIKKEDAEAGLKIAKKASKDTPSLLETLF